MSVRRLTFLLSGILLCAVSLLSQERGGASQSVADFFLKPKYLTMILLGLLALILLKSWFMRAPLKVLMLFVAVFFFGIAGNLNLPFFSGYALHPSPICAVTKSILYGFAKPMVVMAAVMVFLTLIGPKLFCGWVCPVGALQELLAMLTRRLRLRRFRVPFRVSQSVRILFFLLFAFLSGTAVIHMVSAGQVYALSLYDWLNAFHGYEFQWQAALVANLLHYLPLLLTALAALFLYRPFCHFVCPVGLLAHLLEPVAWLRINRKKGACNDCQACILQTPCQAVPEILKDAPLRPECHACGDCLQNCSRDAFALG